MKSALLVLRRASLFVAAATMLALVPPAISGASSNPTWTVVAVPGATQTFPVEINDFGIITGYYANPSGYVVGFTDRGGHFTSISYPSAPLTEALWTTDFGVTGGTYVDSAGIEHGFVDVAGKFSSIDDPNEGPLGTYAANENNLGEIVGGYYDSNSCLHGFTLSHGTFTTIDGPGAPCADGGGTFVSDVNDLGTLAMVQFFAPGGPPSYTYLSFTYQRGAYTPIVNPLAESEGTEGSYVTDFGVVGGIYFDASGHVNGFIESHGNYTTLDDPSAGAGPGQGTFLQGGNNLGAIVGYYLDASDNGVGFVVTMH